MWKRLLAICACTKRLQPAFLSDEAVFTTDSATAAATASYLMDKGLLLVSAVLVTSLAVWQATTSFHTTIFTPFSLPEEAAYTFISARNYIEHGFLNSLFLQDFSTSPDAADHPFVYNHMPAGPDIFAAILMRITDSNYVAMRVVYSVFAVAGFYTYYAFCKAFLSRVGLIGAGVALLFVGPSALIQILDRQIYAPFALMAFLPLLLYMRYIDTGSRVTFYSALGIIFASSLYFEYSLLSGMAASWGMLFLTRLLPISFREIICVAMAFAAGVLVHLIQNALYLGWPTFIQELQYTISNRITGFPTQSELADYYRNLALLHHGSRPVQLDVIWSQIASNFSTAGFLPVLGAAVACLIWMGLSPALSRTSRLPQSAKFFDSLSLPSLLFAKLLMFAAGTILFPIMLFPAFAQEVNLRGMGASSFYLGIGFAAIAGTTWSFLFYIGHKAATGGLQKAGAVGVSANLDPASTVRGLFVRLALTTSIFCMSISLALSAYEIVSQTKAQLLHIRSVARSGGQWAPLHDLERFRGALFMTNINVPTVGVITRAPGFGVCPPESVEADGRVHVRLCKTAFVRRYDYWTSRRPRYFYYFNTPALFPGFADCLPQETLWGQERGGRRCMDDLADRLFARYPLVMENKLVKVFDLDRASVHKLP